MARHARGAERPAIQKGGLLRKRLAMAGGCEWSAGKWENYQVVIVGHVQIARAAYFGIAPIGR
jgi:hypothetical protein